MVNRPGDYQKSLSDIFSLPGPFTPPIYCNAELGFHPGSDPVVAPLLRLDHLYGPLDRREGTDKSEGEEFLVDAERISLTPNWSPYATNTDRYL